MGSIPGQELRSRMPRSAAKKQTNKNTQYLGSAIKRGMPVIFLQPNSMWFDARASGHLPPPGKAVVVLNSSPLGWESLRGP